MLYSESQYVHPRRERSERTLTRFVPAGAGMMMKSSKLSLVHTTAVFGFV